MAKTAINRLHNLFYGKSSKIPDLMAEWQHFHDKIPCLGHNQANLSGGITSLVVI